jgi:hypothetical protein
MDSINLGIKQGSFRNSKIVVAKWYQCQWKSKKELNKEEKNEMNEMRERERERERIWWNEEKWLAQKV